MPFSVPQDHADLSRQVFSRFRSLVNNYAIDIVTATEFDAWRRNFDSDEEKYLAAQMLSAAVIRTQRMNKSGYRQILEAILPSLLRDAGLWNFDYIDEMEAKLSDRTAPISVRFMPVDGQRLDDRPGNSGDAVLREFGQLARIADRYFVRADDAEIWQNPPDLLIFLDDLLGTGSQFTRFATNYGVANLPATTLCAYVPLMAARQGKDAVAQAHPRVTISPVETLQTSAAFFSESASTPGIWARDGHNSVRDVRDFYQNLMTDRRVGLESRHSLELTVLLPGRPPNNTLKAYWFGNDQWAPLLRR